MTMSNKRRAARLLVAFALKGFLGRLQMSVFASTVVGAPLSLVTCAATWTKVPFDCITAPQVDQRHFIKKVFIQLDRGVESALIWISAILMKQAGAILMRRRHARRGSAP